jgi:hypothetical protein
MIKVKFLRTVRGDVNYEQDKVYVLTPNEAYAWIERRYAKAFKEEAEAKDFEEAPKDKMIKKARGRKKLNKKI